MQFALYTDKTIPQCLTAINERMHAKATSTRPALDGWVEKGGAFSLSMSAPVMGRFARRTTLKGQIEREEGVTIIRGGVPGGVPRQGQVLIFVALALVALTIIGSGNTLVGLLLFPMAAVLYIPMQGDYLNSEVLLDEVEKTLKAKPTPPKALAQPKAAAAPRSKSPRSKTATTKTSPPRPKPAARSSRPAAPVAANTPAPPAPDPVTVSPAKPEPPPESEFPLLPGEPPP